MAKNKMGRPHKMTNGRNIIYEVLQSLPKDGSPIKFKELRITVKMSSATLSKALFYLLVVGVVQKRKAPSGRAPYMEYSLSPKYGIWDWDSDIKDKQNFLITHKKDYPEPKHLLGDIEFNQAMNLCDSLDIIDSVILDCLKLYANTDKKQKENAFDTYLYVISGMIKSLKNIVSEPIGLTDFTFSISRRARNQSGSLIASVKKSAEIMGLQKQEDGSLIPLNYPLDELKRLLAGNLVEEKIMKSIDTDLKSQI